MLVLPFAVLGAVTAGGWVYHHVIVRKLSRRIEKLERR